MTTAQRDALLLFGAGLILNGLVALLTTDPRYLDAYYYFNGGRIIAQTGALVEPYFWNYVAAPPSLPAPAFSYWGPLPAFIAAGGIRLLGGLMPLFGAAQVPFVVLAALLPPLAYLIGRQVGERRHALLGGLLMLMGGYFLIYWSIPETFTPFALAGAGTLAAISSGRQQGALWPWAAAGICAGLGYLTRGDGPLLIIWVMLFALVPARIDTTSSMVPGRTTVRVLLALAGFMLITLPWMVRNWQAFGAVTGQGGLSTLWMLTYNDLFNYPTNLTPQRYLAAGLGVIMQGKLQALGANLMSFIAVNNFIFLVPFSLTAVIKRWRHPWVLPMTSYGAALFLAMTFAFTFPGMNGGWFHSSAALMPFLMPLAAIGLEDVLRWIGRRRPTWRYERTWPLFSRVAVLGAAALTGWLVLGGVRVTQHPWNKAGRGFAQLAPFFEEHEVPPTALIMSNSTVAVHYHTGRGGIPLVNGDEETAARAMQAYGAAYLLLDFNVPDDLIPFYEARRSTQQFDLIGQVETDAGTYYLYRLRPATQAP